MKFEFRNRRIERYGRSVDVKVDDLDFEPFPELENRQIDAVPYMLGINDDDPSFQLYLTQLTVDFRAYCDGLDIKVIERRKRVATSHNKNSWYTNNDFITTELLNDTKRYVVEALESFIEKSPNDKFNDHFISVISKIKTQEPVFKSVKISHSNRFPGLDASGKLSGSPRSFCYLLSAIYSSRKRITSVTY